MTARKMSVHRLSSIMRHERESEVMSRLSTVDLRDWEGLIGKKCDEANDEGSSAKQAATLRNASRTTSRSDTGEPQEGSIERRILYFGLLFLLLAILGDALRLVVERTAISYWGESQGEAQVDYTSYVLMLCIAACLSMTGVLGVTVLFVVSAQIHYVSRVLIQPNIFLMRALTANERQFVRETFMPAAAAAATSELSKKQN